MGAFSQAIQKYYQRQGRVVVFNNGLSLNRLAFKIWEDNQLSAIDPSVISRVINGKRLFSRAQFDSFCKTLNIGESEKKELEGCLIKDYALRSEYDFSGTMDSRKVSINLLGYLVENIERDRLKKPIHFMFDLTLDVNDLFENLFKSKRANMLDKGILELYARNALNFMFCYPSTFESYSRVKLNQIKKFATILKVAATELNSEYYGTMSRIAFHAYNYYRKNFDYIMQLSKEVVDGKTVGQVWYVDIVNSKIKSQVQMSRDVVDSEYEFINGSAFSVDDKAKLCGAVAKGCIEVNKINMAQRYLDRAKRWHELTDKGDEFYFMREAQLGMYEALLIEKQRRDLSSTEKSLVKNSYHTAKRIGHKVYTKALSRFVDEPVNDKSNTTG